MGCLPVITNHALVRFYERFEGMDTCSIRADLDLNPEVQFEWLMECWRYDLSPEQDSGIQLKTKIYDRKIVDHFSKNGVDEAASKLRILEIFAEAPQYARAIEQCGLLALRVITIGKETFKFEDGKLTTMYRDLGISRERSSRKKVIKDKNRYCYEI